ncbi:hypothetical protein [Aliiglaciecola litoralis]|uniref:Outer membrane protein beta-barrel domain-containing protein n=1 Tax=Aliiglaciecola litoralis TaxID=582857 RepID=A0ABP3WWV8_9ALTE
MNIRNVLPVLVVSLCSPYVDAQDVRVIAGLSMGYSNFEFAEKLDHNISFASASVPIAFTYQQWQASINLQTSLSDADISEEEDVGQASRKDADFTLGYRVDDNWSVFAGYKYGKTNMQFTPRDDEEESAVTTQESYAQKGPFVGVSYAWKFEKAGSLALSVAYADLRAINNFVANTDDDDEEIEELEFDDLSGRVTGDTHGFSYAISWTMPLSSQLLFQTRFKINDYQQDIEFNGTAFKDIDETFTSLQVGLAYVF